MASAYLSSRSKKRQARKARRAAREQREYFIKIAKHTQRTLNREIDTMRTLRDLDLPAFHQAAKVAQLQQRKGFELAQRRRQLGRLPEDYRNAVFGGSLQQYLGRESMRMEHYGKMSQMIFQGAERTQAQVNDILKAGGMEYGRMMTTAQKMDFEAGDSGAQMLGAAAQGMSLAASEAAKSGTPDPDPGVMPATYKPPSGAAPTTSTGPMTASQVGWDPDPFGIPQWNRPGWMNQQNPSPVHGW
jgi:hypothetical protein